MPARRSVRRRWGLAATVPWAAWAGLRATGSERGFPLVPALSFTPYAATTALVPLALAARARSATAALAAAGSGAVLAAAGSWPPVPCSTSSGAATSTSSPCRS
jgi:hypothetical protein